MIVKEFNIESNTYFGIECDKNFFKKITISKNRCILLKVFWEYSYVRSVFYDQSEKQRGLSFEVFRAHR